LRRSATSYFLEFVFISSQGPYMLRKMLAESEPILGRENDSNEKEDIVIPMLDNVNADHLVEEETVFDQNGISYKTFEDKKGVMESNLNSINLILIVVGVLSIAFMVSLFILFLIFLYHYAATVTQRI
jgi:hypothetical protein